MVNARHAGGERVPMIFRRIAAWHCRLFHGPRALMHPVAGQYRCRVCLTVWPVPWADAGPDHPTAKAIRPEPPVITGLERHAMETEWRRELDLAVERKRR